MKSHRSRRSLAGAALVLSLTLAGCAQADPGAAGRLGDRVVSEQDVLTATQELAQQGLGEQADASMVARLLVLGPILLDNLRQDAGIVVSDDDGRRLLSDPRAPLSQPTLTALRVVAGDSVIQEAMRAQGQPTPGNAGQARYAKIVKAGEDTSADIKKAFDDGTIQMNPKYFKQPVDWVSQDQAPQQP